MWTINIMIKLALLQFPTPSYYLCVNHLIDDALTINFLTHNFWINFFSQLKIIIWWFWHFSKRWKILLWWWDFVVTKKINKFQFNYNVRLGWQLLIKKLFERNLINWHHSHSSLSFTKKLLSSSFILTDRTQKTEILKFTRARSRNQKSHKSYSARILRALAKWITRLLYLLLSLLSKKHSHLLFSPTRSILWILIL